MEKPKFTPGEWEVCGKDSSDGIPFIDISCGECPSPQYKAIAEVQSTFDGEDDFSLTPEDWANARLIAAAPDMYEVVRLVVERMDAEEMAEADVDDFMAVWTEIHEKARAALSKANGESGDV